MKIGNRKYTGFVLAIALYTAVVMVSLFKHNGTIEMNGFVFQLASAYGIICGLFFGSNVLEHYAGRNKSE